MTAARPHAGSRPLRDLTVAELVARSRAGSGPSFGELVGRFEGRLYNFLLRRVGRPAEAEDLAQETFVRAWQRLEQYDDRWQFSTWLFTIGGRLAIARLRREGPRRTVPIDGPGPSGCAASPAAPDPARAASDREQCGRLWDLADRLLPETQRAALWLRYAEELPPRVIARVLGRSQIGVRVMLFRARQTLAEHAGDRARSRPPEPADAPRPRGRAANPALPEPVPGGAP